MPSVLLAIHTNPSLSRVDKFNYMVSLLESSDHMGIADICPHQQTATRYQAYRHSEDDRREVGFGVSNEDL